MKWASVPICKSMKEVEKPNELIKWKEMKWKGVFIVVERVKLIERVVTKGKPNASWLKLMRYEINDEARSKVPDWGWLKGVKRIEDRKKVPHEGRSDSFKQPSFLHSLRQCEWKESGLIELNTKLTVLPLLHCFHSVFISINSINFHSNIRIACIAYIITVMRLNKFMIFKTYNFVHNGLISMNYGTIL